MKAKDRFEKAGFKKIALTSVTYELAEKQALEFWDKAIEVASSVAANASTDHILPSMRHAYRMARLDIAKLILKEKITSVKGRGRG